MKIHKFDSWLYFGFKQVKTAKIKCNYEPNFMRLNGKYFCFQWKDVTCKKCLKFRT